MPKGMLPDDPELLAQLSHEELYRARAKPGADQGMLAPAEHRAFAREFAQESPVRAAISLPFAIPAYTAAKAVGLQNARTPPSLEEMGAGYTGMLEGLFRRFDEDAFRINRGSREFDRERAEYRARAAAEGAQALRRLIDIIKGGKPSRDLNYEPPPRLEPKGRAQKQPPIIGVRG